MIIDDIYNKLMDCIQQLPERFNTYEVIQIFKSRYLQDWNILEERYGRGGKGNGRYYTAFTYIAQCLKNMSKRGMIRQELFQPAPEEWGNPEIATWSR